MQREGRDRREERRGGEIEGREGREIEGRERMNDTSSINAFMIIIDFRDIPISIRI